MSGREIVLKSEAELIGASEVPAILRAIRPEWQARNLIERVHRLLLVDPSSACQRLFNAAIHDLREKIVVAGIDIARDAAKNYKLPPVERQDDVQAYSTQNVIDLAYRMGLLTYADWRRLSRSYEIRRDLEHEDDQYEAGLEDLVYIAKTTVEIVLARDPVFLLKVTDVKDIIEQPKPAIASADLVGDYQYAPQPRQEEIMGFLMNGALDQSQPEVVRQNAIQVLRQFKPITQNAVKLNVAAKFQERQGRKPLETIHARVAFAAGILPYLKRKQLTDFFEQLYGAMREVGYDWTSHTQHGDLLRMLKEIGGLAHAPESTRRKLVEWLVLCYIGEPGGYGTWGRNRKVFYSDAAAPLIRDLTSDARDQVAELLRTCESSPIVKRAAQDEYVARRYQELLDLVEPVATSS